jgi:hypothetical protein
MEWNIQWYGTIFCHMAMDEKYSWMKKWMINKMDELL